MGLDQYIRAKHYNTEEEFNAGKYAGEYLSPAVRRIDNFNAYAELPEEDRERLHAVYIELEDIANKYRPQTLIDLRKANAIHGYIVDRVMDGDIEYNSKEVIVDNEVMDELVDKCKEVLELYRRAIQEHVGSDMEIPKPLWEYEQIEYAIETIVPGFSSRDFQGAAEFQELVAAEFSELAAEILPPMDGFFFGDAEWESWQLYQTHRFVRAIMNFTAEEGAYTLYTYDCWW